ncbi:MAG: 3D-(3,5/4)-trihydroxycyclohexane-1,2-dione acylhydrolase (decyclizing) [Candidatus Competibacteraceae bacterium]|nr:3D-(3,5/4)-trihydroxycyclohexane-1,2-dione acylhydrolase (decyclizing) [Candidatus Competibacteraceae bacterium]
MDTVRLTMAQALVQYLCAQKVEIDGQELSLFAGILAIFGHGNVSGICEALHAAREEIPTYRAHNEQGMAHIAIAYAKANDRRRLMACTTSVGPGATNMVTAAALAHVNRLPVLLLPGDTFATRAPDPVLQQVENFHDPNLTANDCFRPVSRYWDRICRPEQLLTSLPVAIATLLDPVNCGPVTLALPQDIQAEAYDYPVHFFAPKLHRLRRPGVDPEQLAEAVAVLSKAHKPLLLAGGGVHYSQAREALAQFVETHRIPVLETQAGKGVLPWDHPCNAGSMGVFGTTAGNALVAEADVVLAVGTRLADFTTASRTTPFSPDAKMIGLNVAPFDAIKHYAVPLIGDAKRGLEDLGSHLQSWKAPETWLGKAQELTAKWQQFVDEVTAASDTKLPTDAQVMGAVNRAAGPKDVPVCAAGSLPNELQKLWRTKDGKGFHLEYGYSCMGYEIPGALGVRMAHPDRDVFALMGDGGYMMMNSELTTSVMLGHKIILVLLDNRGYSCINRLQQVCGSAPFNNLLENCLHGEEGIPPVDFAAHAAALGATVEKVNGIAELEQALVRAKNSPRSYAIVIDTDPKPSVQEGGGWWDVAVPEVSTREQVRTARKHYEEAKQPQRI